MISGDDAERVIAGGFDLDQEHPLQQAIGGRAYALDVRRPMPRFRVETEREEDGRWIAEVVEIPGALVYGVTKDEAVRKAEALVLRVIADRLEHDEPAPDVSAFFAA